MRNQAWSRVGVAVAACGAAIGTEAATGYEGAAMPAIAVQPAATQPGPVRHEAEGPVASDARLQDSTLSRPNSVANPRRTRLT